MYLGVPLQLPHIEVVELTNRSGEVVEGFTCTDQTLDVLMWTCVRGAHTWETVSNADLHPISLPKASPTTCRSGLEQGQKDYLSHFDGTRRRKLFVLVDVVTGEENKSSTRIKSPARRRNMPALSHEAQGAQQPAHQYCHTLGEMPIYNVGRKRPACGPRRR